MLRRCSDLSSRRYELRVLDYLRNYVEVVRFVKRLVESIDPNAEVYVFGSVVKGTYTAASDIDVLVVVGDLSRKDEVVVVKVYSETEAPVELHIVTKELLERWYKRFIDKNTLIKIT